MFSRAFLRINLLLVIFAAMLMTACGGGSGSPSDRFEARLSESKMAYGPIELEIIGGRAPFTIRTNTTALEFPRETDSRIVYGFAYPVIDNGTGVVLVEDRNQREVRASFEYVATVFDPSSLTITPGPGANCTQGSSGNYPQICAGSQGIVQLQLNGPGAGNTQVQFSVVLGEFEIREGNTGTWAPTVMTITDSFGRAQVSIRAKVGALTQTAKIRATKMSTNDFTDASFIIVGADFKMLPTSASWTASDATCSASRTASFALYGGVPPYSVQTTLGSVDPAIVTASGGSTVLTVAACGDGVLTAYDAQGSTVTATVSYKASTTPEVTSPDVVVSPMTPPSWGSSGARTSCTIGTRFLFSVNGGTPPYTAYVTSTTEPYPVGSITGYVGQVTFSAAPPDPGLNYSVFVVDSKGKMSVTTPVIYCQ